MQALCDDLKSNTRAIALLWDVAVDLEPWILPRQHARSDFVPELVSLIADCILCSRPSRESVLALAQAAARHAGARASSGADATRVVFEYYLLRNAMWTYFRQRNSPPAGGTDGKEVQAILFVDVAISMATRAALLGYHRPELEAQDRWSGALDRLVDETPLMWAPISNE